MNGRIEVMREELRLGTLSAGDAAELLRVGFLRADDRFRPECEGGGGVASNWRPLSELVTGGPAPVATRDLGSGKDSPEKKSGRGWVDRARATLSTATEMAGSVGAAGVNVVTSASTRLRSLAGQTPSAMSAATGALLEGYLPQIRAALDQALAAAGAANVRALEAVRSGVRDDVLMQKTFGAVYDCLPKPVCRFISEDRFVAFCLEHRTRLLK